MYRRALTTGPWRRAAGTLSLAAVLLAADGVAAGDAPDPVSDVAIKAALLYNFALFTEWPVVRPATSVVICIVGDDRIDAAVAQTTKGKSIGGHALEVRRPTDVATWHTCHLMFIATAETRQLGDAMGALKALPILMVSDRQGFAQVGMIELYVEAERMRFAINLDAVEHSGLRINSRVLMLARIVRNR